MIYPLTEHQAPVPGLRLTGHGLADGPVALHFGGQGVHEAVPIAINLSPRTIYDIAATLRMALEDAVTKGLIAKNPAKLAANRSAGTKEARSLIPEEVRWFLVAAEGERLEAGFILALHTGMRPGEWLGLPWDAVDLAKGTVTIRQALHEENGRVFIGRVKTKASARTITLPEPAIAALVAHARQQQLEKRIAGPA